MALDTQAHIKLGVTVDGAEGVDKLNEALKGVGKTGELSAKQTAQAFRMLPAQFTDIATQLAGGQNPFLILVQQGGQIKDMFGGIGPAFRAIASSLTPFSVAVGGAAVAVTALGGAFYAGWKESSNFEKALLLTGNAVGLLATDLQRLGASAADVSKQTVGFGKDLVQAAVATGAFSSTTIEPAIRTMARLADLTSQSAEDIAKDFAGMANGVANWAATHNRVYGYLTQDQFRYIRSLEEAGKKEEAMRENMRLLESSLKQRERDLGYIETAWVNVKKAASDAIDTMMNWGRGGSPSQGMQDQLRQLEMQLNKAKADALTGNQSFGNDALIAELDRQIKMKKLAITELEKVEKGKANNLRSEQEKINRDASGLNDRLAATVAQQTLNTQKRLTDALIADTERRAVTLESSRARMLIEERKYVDESTKIKLEEIQQQINLAQARKKAEAATPARGEDGIAQKTLRLNQLDTEIAQLQEKLATARLTGALKGAEVDEEMNRFKVKKSLELQIIDYNKSADEKIAAVQREQMVLQGLREKQQISERDYVAKSNQLIVQELRLQRDKSAQKLVIAQKELDQGLVLTEKQRIDQENRKAALEAEIALINQRIATAELRGAAEVNVVDDRQTKELRYFTEELQFQNEMLKLQASEVNMTSLAYKQLVDAKQREYDIMVKTRGMSTAQAEEYKAAANAAGSYKVELEKANYEQSRSALTGAKNFFKEYTENAQNSAQAVKTALTGAFKSAEDALVEFTMTGKVSFSDFANSVLADMVRMAYQQAIIAPLMAGFNSYLSGLGGSVSGTGSVPSATNGGGYGKFYANGGAFINGVQKFANGGVVTRPTLFPMANGAGLMGEAGPEAIMPLKRGADGRLGVSGAGGSTSVVVNNYSGSEAKTKESIDSRGNRRIEVTISEMVAGEMSRPGSSVNSSVRNSFGARPALVGR